MHYNIEENMMLDFIFLPILAIGSIICHTDEKLHQ